MVRLRKDLEEIEVKGEAVLILGDLNRAVGCDQWGVTRSHSKVSQGGKLIREMTMEEEYIILNNMTVGGPWTWTKRGKEDVKSCLDIAIASRNLLPYVKSVTIDKNREFTPKRVIRKKGEFIPVYTDHFTMEVKQSDGDAKEKSEV